MNSLTSRAFSDFDMCPQPATSHLVVRCESELFIPHLHPMLAAVNDIDVD